MSSMDVVVNAGGSVSVSSVEGVHVSASDVSVSSSGLVDVSSREVSVVGVDRLEAYGGEEVRVTGGGDRRGVFGSSGRCGRFWCVSDD